MPTWTASFETPPTIGSMESMGGSLSVVSTDLVGLFDDFVRVETRLWNEVDACVKRAHGVPLAWIEVMQVAVVTPGCRVLDVARALTLTVGGASKVVDKVQAAGLCERHPHPHDGRSQLIVLTEAGERLVETARQTRATALTAVLGPAASPSELRQMASVLRRVRARLTEGDHRPAARTAAS